LLCVAKRKKRVFVLFLLLSFSSKDKKGEKDKKGGKK
jgi:hypothetical protein